MSRDELNHDEQPRRKKKWSLGLVLGILAVVFVLCCGPIGVGGYFVWERAVTPARQEVTTAHNLQKIGLAMHNYHDRYKVLPNNTYDAKGQPLLSWRVHILPFLGPEEQALFRQFNVDEPWDGPTNKPLIARMPKVYNSGRPGSAEGFTYYRGFSHEGAIFEKPARPEFPMKIPIAAIVDGLAGTIMVIDAGESAEWTRPLDIDWSPGQARPALGGPGRSHCMVLMCDASVHPLRKDVADQTLRDLIGRRDGNVIPAGWDE
jgi:Protein of unknown function (DUF1559)